jgi:hypothetical protein
MRVIIKMKKSKYIIRWYRDKRYTKMYPFRFRKMRGKNSYRSKWSGGAMDKFRKWHPWPEYEITIIIDVEMEKRTSAGY